MDGGDSESGAGLPYRCSTGCVIDASCTTRCAKSESRQQSRVSWRWLILDYVDPELGLSRAERRTVRRRARRHARLTVSGALLIMLCIVPLLAFYGWGVAHYAGRFVNAIVPQAGELLRVVIVYVALWIVVAWLGRWMYRPFVLRAVREIGYDVCPRCGYWLRGLDENIVAACPECGAARPQSSNRK